MIDCVTYQRQNKTSVQRLRAMALVSLLVMIALYGCASKPVTNENDNDAVGISGATTVPVNDADVKKYHEIRDHLIKGEYAVAEAKLQLIIAKFPNHSGSWANLGLVYSETQRLEQAESALKKSIAIDPNNAAVYLRLASVYKEQGKLVDALKTYQQSIEVDARNPKAHYNIAILYDLYLQDRPKALSHLKTYMNITGSKDQQTLSWIKQLERDKRRQQTVQN